MLLLMLDAPPAKRSRHEGEKTQQLKGHVVNLQMSDRYLHVRFGNEPGEYLILYVPQECRVHRCGQLIPLKDVQFCDRVSVSYHQHHRFDVQLAQEIEVC